MAAQTKDFDNLSPVKQAMLQLREMREKLDEFEQANTEPIAIIGMGLRFPGGVIDQKTYWQLLHDSGSAISKIPADRWNLDAFYDPDPTVPGKMYTRSGGFLDDVGMFDAHFFNIAPREAINMDPQQRLLLQVSWEALENAGQAPDQLYNTQTGVFIAISNSDYGRLVARDLNDIDVYFATGTTFSVAAGRLSYFLGLKGPSIAVDTACSGSLVAIHLACQSLRNKESNLALAGGVNLILSPEGNINFSKAQMMARDDHCKTFDAAADGYVRGEGCSVVVLKRLSDALTNRDPILAIIRGSAVNQDGRSSGLTAPNGPSQEAVIRQALVNARVKPHQVNYVEAHGTGTPLGDPIEVQALAAVLCDGRSMDDPLMIGSVKTNIGHLEAAAGMAGLLKVVLSLQHQEIPPHLHLQNLNPHIPWEKIAITVPTQITAWPIKESPRIGGVSSFGFSGTNAHIVLEEAPRSDQDVIGEDVHVIERPLHLLNLSAKRPAALSELLNRFDTLLAEGHANFRDICFTSNVRRAHLNHRLSVVASSAIEAREKLAAFVAGQAPSGVYSGQTSSADESEITFLFTGHGSQYPKMGKQLFETQPTFRVHMTQCEQLLIPFLELPLLSLLYPVSEDQEIVASRLMNTMTYAQPALFALEYSLAKLWISWGVEPAFVMGHSVGEYAAACIAGVFSLSDGLKLVATRGRLMDSLQQKGKMVTVFAGEAQVAAVIAPYLDQVSIAAVNGSTHVVISGTETAIQTITAIFEEGGIQMRNLAIAQAAHSPVLEPILDEFEKVASEITYARPHTGIISASTGKLASSEITTPGYWRNHLRETVQFSSAMESLAQNGQRTFIEIGPHPTLLGMGRRCLPELDETGLWLPSMRKGQQDWQEILESLAALYVRGSAINWTEFEHPYRGGYTQLPNYPWARDHHWIDRETGKQSADQHSKPMLWETVTSAGRQQAQQAPLNFALHAYPAKWNILDELTKAQIVDTVRAWNLFTKPNETHTLETFMEQTSILPNYAGLISRWLEQLADSGLLVRKENQYKSQQPLPVIPMTPLWEKAEEILADNSPLLDYLKRCSDKIIPVLSGKENPLETLFPQGSYTTVDYLYHNWPLVRYFNGILQAIVGAVVNRIPSGKKLRILEIGAGTGGSTAALLSLLPADQIQYQFTDVSDFFLSHAEEKFSAYPFLQYAILDIEKDPEAQGYAPQSVDVIIAANALHATRDLTITLAHVQKLLAPGGLLLLLEGTKYLPWLDITTSLIEGWGRFEDQYRTDNPLLSADQWKDVLKNSGFDNIIALPEDHDLSGLLVHNIIVAQVEAIELSLATADSAQTLLESDLTKQEPVAAVMKPMQQLIEALPDDRQDLLINYIRSHVATILRLTPSHPLGQKDRLMDLGLDSLMAVELRSRIGKGLELEHPLSATLVFDYPTIQAIAEHLNNELFGARERSNTIESTSQTKTDPAIEGVEFSNLSDEEVEKLLLKKLDDLS